MTINTACAVGRPSGVSILSLGNLTLGKMGAIITATSYTLLHYAILTAYTSQGTIEAFNLLTTFSSSLNILLTIPLPSSLSSFIGGTVFASVIGGAMYFLPSQTVAKLNNALVGGVLATFAAVLVQSIGNVDGTRLLESNWAAVPHNQLIPVLFVSCVYHNVVSTITMRLEGDREKIRQTILIGSAIPIAMFVAYNAVILGSITPAAGHQNTIGAFSLLAITTSFVGFVEGLTDLWADARQTFLKTEMASKDGRWFDFAATLLPPAIFAGISPDIFLNALDAAGTYGIAVLFGALPAGMAWQNRRKETTKDFDVMVNGGDAALALVGLIPLILIGNRIWDTFHGFL